jgi:hypothetical protein
MLFERLSEDMAVLLSLWVPRFLTHRFRPYSRQGIHQVPNHDLGTVMPGDPGFGFGSAAGGRTGALVAVHSNYKAGVDIFRFNDDGKIIERWDAPAGAGDHRQRERHVLPAHVAQALENSGERPRGSATPTKTTATSRAM